MRINTTSATGSFIDELVVHNVLGTVRFFESQPPRCAPSGVNRSGFPHYNDFQLLPRRDFSKKLSRKNDLPALAHCGFKLDSFHGATSVFMMAYADRTHITALRLRILSRSSLKEEKKREKRKEKGNVLDWRIVGFTR